MNKKLHIICFDIPLPADYGGAIDVFHKLRSLSELGTKIYLHIFKYGRPEQSELKRYCEEIHYYNRNTSVYKALGILPYIVASRNSKSLISNIERIEAPILFEGLHTTLLLRKNVFKDRIQLVRTHNIEHLYYRQLAVSESNVFKKLFYFLEASKLKRYEKVLKHCNHILPVSTIESLHFKELFGDKITYIPPFHANKQLHELSKKGYFALFHANLSISENKKAALFFINIFKSIKYPLVIAGQSEDKSLLQKIDLCNNINFIPIADDQKLKELFHRAQVNVLYSFNASGVKLKLVNALYHSRFVIANDKVIQGSGLEPLCIVANDKKQFINEVLGIVDKEFSEDELKHRKELLMTYDNKVNARKILDLI